MPTTINPSGQTITQYNIQTGGSNNLLNNVSPSSTSGNPLVSQGSSSQPIFSATPTVTSMTITGTPSAGTDAANVTYVTNAIAAVNPAVNVVAATTANLNATYLNGVSGIGATLTNAGSLVAFSIDGQSPTLNQRVLVKNQSTTANNGVYTVTTVGSGAIAWVLTRALDYDQPSDINSTGIINVLNGTANAGTGWVINSTVTTVGTDAITYTQFIYPATTFLQVANNLSDLNSASTARSNLGLTAVATQTVTQYDVLVGGASNAITSIGPGSTGQVLQSGGNAANPAYSTATYPATAGTSGNILTSDGTNWNSTAPASQFTPNSVVRLKDDFFSVDPTVSTLTSELAWSISATGWGMTNNSSGLTNTGHPGLISHTSTTGSRPLTLGDFGGVGTSMFFLGGGALTINWVFYIQTPSDGTNTYTLTLGIGDTVTTTAVVNGVWLAYSNGLNSGQWTYNTASASTATNSNSSTAVTSGAWHNAQISINAAGTSATFVMDGVTLGTINTNLPTTSITPFISIIRSAGTIPAGSVLVDLFYLTQTLTTPR